jgi:hypothetical protein
MQRCISLAAPSTLPPVTEARPIRIMRALAGAPDGLSTPAIVAELAEGIPSNQRALSWYGQILRSRAKQGHVENAGKISGRGWQRPPVIIWRITGEGRKLLARIDDEPARKARAEQAAIEQEEASRAQTSALAEAARLYSRHTPRSVRRPAAARLRELGCSLEEIGQVFGVSREMIRQDCLPFEPRPERPARVPGRRLVDAAVLNGVMAVRMGKRTIYFTRAEARYLAEIIDNWDSDQPSAASA